MHKRRYAGSLDLRTRLHADAEIIALPRLPSSSQPCHRIAINSQSRVTKSHPKYPDLAVLTPTAEIPTHYGNNRKQFNTVNKIHLPDTLGVLKT
jgi:hypothetical protein